MSGVGALLGLAQPLNAETRERPVPAEEHTLDRFKVEMPAGSSNIEWVPFDFFRDNRILVPVVIDNIPATALIDTGADIVMVSGALAKELSRSSDAAIVVATTSGATTAPLLRDVKVELGNVRLHAITAAVVNLATPSLALGRKIDLVLGRELFEHLIVRIDFADQRIGFQRPADFKPPQGSVRVPLRRFNRSRTIDVSIEGGPVVPMQFDLGIDMPVMLNEPYWSKQEYLSNRRSSTMLFAGAAGAREAQIATFREISIAGQRISEVSVTFAPSRGDAERLLPPGIVGMPVLSRFDIVTDYSRDVLYLTKRRLGGQAKLPKDRAGLRLVYEGDRLRILLVARSSPAAEQGWSIGDLIVEVNGQRVGSDYWSSDLWRWTTSPAGTRVKLRLADGSERILILNDYF